MSRWHCQSHYTAGNLTSLMEILTYDPRSMEPLLNNLSHQFNPFSHGLSDQRLVMGGLKGTLDIDHFNDFANSVFKGA